MGKDQDRHKKEFDLDQLLKESFGMDDQSLLERFQCAQTEIDDSQIPDEQDDGFERLVDKIEDRGIKPNDKSNFIIKGWGWNRRRLKPAFKVAVVAGVLVVGVTAGTMTVAANKYFKYRKTVKYSVRNDVVLDNDDNLIQAGRLIEAYEKIEKNIGLDALRLEYLPSEMIYSKTTMNDKSATMYFDYKENIFYIFLSSKDGGDSTNIVSDRKIKSDIIYNAWLNRDIEIEEIKTKGGANEFSAEITQDNTIYYVAGIMEKDEFIEIIRNLYIE